MSARVTRFQPFEEAELRIRVTVEVLDPGEAFDCCVVAALEGASVLTDELELKAVQRARQLLAVASYTLTNENSSSLKRRMKSAVTCIT